MVEKNKIKCPKCGETDDIYEHSRIETFDGTIIRYKCSKCQIIFNNNF